MGRKERKERKERKKRTRKEQLRLLVPLLLPLLSPGPLVPFTLTHRRKRLHRQKRERKDDFCTFI